MTGCLVALWAAAAAATPLQTPEVDSTCHDAEPTSLRQIVNSMALDGVEVWCLAKDSPNRFMACADFASSDGICAGVLVPGRACARLVRLSPGAALMSAVL